MDAWLDRAVDFLDAFGKTLDRTATEWGISPLFVIAGVMILGLILNVLRSVPTRKRLEAEMRRPPSSAAATDAARTVDVDFMSAVRATRTPAPARGPSGGASATGGIVLALVGLGIIGGAAYFMYEAPQHSPEWRASIYLFGSLVALLGLGFVNGGVGSLFQPRIPGNDATQWLRDARWSRDGTGPVAAERIGSGGLGLALFAAYLLPFHSVLAAPFTHIAFWIALGILDLVFVVAVAFFVQSLRSWLLGGGAKLRWTRAPFFPGQTLNARLETGRALDGEISVSLLCLKANGSAQALDAEPPNPTEAWRDELRVRMQRNASGGSFADLAIPIPEDAPATLRSGEASVWWRLEARMSIEGPDFVVTFALPVYARPAAA